MTFAFYFLVSLIGLALASCGSCQHLRRAQHHMNNAEQKMPGVKHRTNVEQVKFVASETGGAKIYSQIVDLDTVVIKSEAGQMEKVAANQAQSGSLLNSFIGAPFHVEVRK